jgi:molybdopterin synthase sulfur carrier subunit
VTATIRLPRVLTETAGGKQRHEVEGSTLGEILESLFVEEPGLRNHLLDEKGEIRPHVLMFVDANRADLQTHVGAHSEVQVLQAVSGG